jgi:thiol-disulfide isomerase/thioredoxin/TolA-binding protein
MPVRVPFFRFAVTFASLLIPAASFAQSPTAADALKLRPVQRDVDYDQPAEKELAKCTIKAEKINGQTGWIVRDPNGLVLREFVDTNKDNVVDRWSYFRNGIEVYRDIDDNFSGKADNYRWLNTAGTRWGVDKGEDGRIDSWKVISPEEVSAELVMALRDRDPQRFARLLLTESELNSLGLGSSKSKEIATKLEEAARQFGILMGRQKLVNAKTAWIHFAANKPAMVPAGTDGSKSDLVVYENVMAMIETEGKSDQLPVGTIVKVGEIWRLIDVPPITGATDKVQGFTVFIPYREPTQGFDETAGAPSEKVQALIEEVQKLDAEINKAATPEQQAKLNDRRADTLEKIIDEIDPKERSVWVRGFADTVSAAAQGGAYPTGLARLKEMFERLQKEDDKELAAYVKFREMTAAYGASMQEADADYAKVHSNWLENLEKFVEEFPDSPDSADAMLQLGLAQEVAGQEEKATAWYGKIVAKFPQAASAKKAAGAIARLNSVGKSINLRGKALTGEAVDLAKLKGKVVLVHYWATWSEPCKVEIAQLKELQAKYGKDGFSLIGVSLDSDGQDLVDYLKRNRLPWPQLFEPGGFDSRYANELGILALPTMILIDDKGKVLNRGIHITQVDSELKNLFKE